MCYQDAASYRNGVTSGVYTATRVLVCMGLIGGRRPLEAPHVTHAHACDMLSSMEQNTKDLSILVLWWTWVG